MSTIDAQRRAVSAARAIIDDGHAPRKSEASHLRPLLLDAEATLAKAATVEAEVAATKDQVRR